ncbi:hypothetical protein AHF37_11769 [Paragonimus kellicotti]|nr:hypothetical protein AHF37_11769 [Paragonimus kellicotti]
MDVTILPLSLSNSHGGDRLFLVPRINTKNAFCCGSYFRGNLSALSYTRTGQHKLHLVSRCCHVATLPVAGIR